MAKFMGTSRVMEKTSTEGLQHNILLAKIEYAFFKLEHEYDWYLAEELMNTKGITFDTDVELMISQLKAVLTQAGY